MRYTSLLLATVAALAIGLFSKPATAAYQVIVVTDGGDTEPTPETIRSYNSNGSLAMTFPDPFAGAGLRWQRAAIGPDGMLYVTSFQFDNVYRFNPTTGASLGAYLSGVGPPRVNAAIDLAFGSDGNLYVTSESDGVRRFQGPSGGTPGLFIDQFVAASHVRGITSGPNGNLFIGEGAGSTVYERTTGGAAVGTYVSGLTTFDNSIAFYNGDLFIARNNADSISRFDGSTLSTFVTAGSGGLDAPNGLAFTPDGYLLVVSRNTDQVLRYNAATGAYVDVFATVPANESPTGIAILVPEPATIGLIACGLLACGRRRRASGR